MSCVDCVLALAHERIEACRIWLKILLDALLPRIQLDVIRWWEQCVRVLVRSVEILFAFAQPLVAVAATDAVLAWEPKMGVPGGILMTATTEAAQFAQKGLVTQGDADVSNFEGQIKVAVDDANIARSLVEHTASFECLPSTSEV